MSGKISTEAVEGCALAVFLLYRRLFYFDHKWTKLPTCIAGEERPYDFCVVRNGVALGRVLPAQYVEGAQPFLRHSCTHPAQSGGADSLGDALRQCRAAIGSGPVPEHIARRLGDYTI